LNRKSSLILLSLFLILALASFHDVKAYGGKILTAPTGKNVKINGNFQAGNWSDATQLSDPWTSNNGSLTTKVQLWVKTNGTDLLIAVGSNGPINLNSGPDTYNYTLSLLIDNNNNGVIDNGENAKSLGMTFSSATTFTQTYRDLHYNSATGSYVNSANLLGVAAGNHTVSGLWSWEFAMPLSSSDFTLAQNASIGMDIVYSEQHYSSAVLVSSGWAYWQESYSTGYPTGPLPSADPWASIYWTNLPAPIVDNTPPTIATPTLKPSSPGPSDTVTVSVNVTDDSSVKNVSITYTTDNWKSVNKTLIASYNGTTHIATAQIPALQFGGHVEYYITAFDSVGLKTVNNNAGAYFSYDVSAPWFASIWFYYILLIILAIVIALAIIYLMRRRRSAKHTSPPSP
jgi:TRAP-type C4-dicarboxylate transport system permease small subunit